MSESLKPGRLRTPADILAAVQLQVISSGEARALLGIAGSVPAPTPAMISPLHPQEPGWEPLLLPSDVADEIIISPLVPPVAGPEWFERLARRYLQQLLRSNRSPSYLQTCRYALRGLGLELQARRVDEVASARPAHVRAWQDVLTAGHLVPGTRRTYVAIVGGMLKWAAKTGELDRRFASVLDPVHAPAMAPRPIPSETLARLLEHLAPRPEMENIPLRSFGPSPDERLFVRRRDRALFYFLLSTSARISEALSVDRDQLDRAQSAMVVQKGGTEKLLMWGETTQAAIADYLELRGDPHPALWVTSFVRSGTGRVSRLGANAVLRCWARLADDLGVRRFTTHQIRHTAATELLDAEIPETVIAQIMGHRGLKLLANYAQVRTRSRGRAVAVMDTLIAKAGGS